QCMPKPESPCPANASAIVLPQQAQRGPARGEASLLQRAELEGSDQNQRSPEHQSRPGCQPTPVLDQHVYARVGGECDQREGRPCDQVRRDDGNPAPRRSRPPSADGPEQL